jgi:3-dehydroquinate dehydratase
MRKEEKMSTKKKFTELPRPFIVGVISEPDPENCIKAIKLSEYDGAVAFDLYLHSLEKKYLNKQDLRTIFSSTNCPVLTLNYRWNLKGLIQITDEERVRQHMLALEAGSAGMDIEADLFDEVPGPVPWTKEAFEYSTNDSSRPRELSFDKKAVERQKKLFKEVQQAGGEVLLSAHTRVPLTAEKIVKIGKELEARGANMAKIVAVCRNQEDVLENIKGCITLKKEIKIPFQLQGHGEQAKVLRVINPMLGAMLVFCHQTFKPGGFHDQPLIRAMKAIFDNTAWINVTRPLEEEKFL